MRVAYHNTAVLVWANRHPGLARYVDRADGAYERVISVAVVTSQDTGRVMLVMTLDEVGGDWGGTPQSIALYEVADRQQAAHDATMLGAQLGLRARFSTVVTGWIWWEYDPEGTTEFPLHVEETI